MLSYKITASKHMSLCIFPFSACLCLSSITIIIYIPHYIIINKCTVINVNWLLFLRSVVNKCFVVIRTATVACFLSPRGVDDILPILSYVILRSGLPQVATECSLMEDFIHEGCV